MAIFMPENNAGRLELPKPGDTVETQLKSPQAIFRRKKLSLGAISAFEVNSRCPPLSGAPSEGVMFSTQ